MVYETVVRRPDPRRPESWCREGASHDHSACGSLWDSTSKAELAEAARWAEAAGPRERLEAKAAELRAAGYVVVSPDDLTHREALDRLHDQQIAIRRQIDEAMVKLGLAMRQFTVLVDPGHEMVNSFYRVAEMVRELRTDLRILRRIHKRARPMRMCQGCGRAGGELTENGCPSCGPDAVITDARGNRLT